MTNQQYWDALGKAGHVLLRGSDGGIDYSAYSVGYCNGPKCVKCRLSWCHHCQPEVKPCAGATVKISKECVRSASYTAADLAMALQLARLVELNDAANMDWNHRDNVNRWLRRCVEEELGR